jgi:hypothetical protein
MARLKLAILPYGRGGQSHLFLSRPAVRLGSHAIDQLTALIVRELRAKNRIAARFAAPRRGKRRFHHQRFQMIRDIL